MWYDYSQIINGFLLCLCNQIIKMAFTSYLYYMKSSKWYSLIRTEKIDVDFSIYIMVKYLQINWDILWEQYVSKNWWPGLAKTLLRYILWSRINHTVIISAGHTIEQSIVDMFAFIYSSFHFKTLQVLKCT